METRKSGRNKWRKKWTLFWEQFEDCIGISIPLDLSARLRSAEEDQRCSGMRTDSGSAAGLINH